MRTENGIRRQGNENVLDNLYRSEEGELTMKKWYDEEYEFTVEVTGWKDLEKE